MSAGNGVASEHGPAGTYQAIADALRFIPNHNLSYPEWIEIGMAIKGALGEAGRSLWEVWSGSAGKNDPKQTAAAWRSLKPNAIGAGSIYHKAREAGWKPDPTIALNPAKASDKDRAKGSGSRIVAVYDYPDEHGELLYQVVRFEPKDFRQRRPDPSARDGWSWSLKGVRRVLYRLAEVLAAGTVYIVEGEKDADRLAAIGVTATTCPQGAGKWQPAFSDLLAGKDVVILPDNDQPGIEHAEAIARSLQGKARSVVTVRLPGLPEKGDVSDWLATGGNREKLELLVELALPAEEAACDPAGDEEEVPPGVRRHLEIKGGERHKLIEQAVEVLAEDEGDGSLYARGNGTVYVRMTVDGDAIRYGPGVSRLPRNMAVLGEARPEHVQLACDRLIAFTTTRPDDKGVFKKIKMDTPRPLAALVLAYGKLRPLTGIVRTPALRTDGSILDRPGYDDATGLYYRPNGTFLPVPDAPTQADAAAALAVLMEPFALFPFAGEADRSVILAEILTLMTRHLVKCAPCFIHDAREAGSGKTKLADTVSIIATGSRALNQSASVLDDPDELRKLLTSLTMSAVPSVLFDNADRGSMVNSPVLSQFLTAGIYGDRLLGTNQRLEAPTTTVVTITGNGIAAAGDMSRRGVTATLDAGVERPEGREFPFEPEELAMQQRARFVRAALTILRARALAGMPKVTGRAALGSFEDWDRRVCGALVFTGAVDPLDAMARTRDEDPERDTLGELLAALMRAFPGRGFKAREPIDLVSRADPTGTSSLRDALDAVAFNPIAQRLEPKRLGLFLKGNAGRVVRGLRLSMHRDAHAEVNLFMVVPVGMP